MAKLIPLEEAADLLSMKPDELVELRSRGDIHGYRDGSTWKFKETELERYAGIQGIELAGEAASGEDDAVQMAAPQGGSGINIDDELDEVVAVDELALSSGEDDVTDLPLGEGEASSTMIGKEELHAELEELELEEEGSGLDLELAEGSQRALDAGSQIEMDSTPSSSSSELQLAPSDSVVGPAGGSEIDIETKESSLKLDMGSALIEEPKSPADSAASGVSDLDIDLGDGPGDLSLSDDELELSVGSSAELDIDGSDLDMVTDSALGLSDPADSDVTVDPSGSGINLSPSDSGLSLERTPPELAVTGEDELELGEAELVEFGEEDIELDDGEGLETDDFVLTPVEGDLADDDSGSQVIALDTDELDTDAGELLEAEGEEPADAGIATVSEGGIPGPIVPAKSETPYSVVDVVGFGLIMLPLLLTGIMLLDLSFHIWSFDQPFAINSTLMDFILGMFGG